MSSDLHRTCQHQSQLLLECGRFHFLGVAFLWLYNYKAESNCGLPWEEGRHIYNRVLNGHCVGQGISSGAGCVRLRYTYNNSINNSIAQITILDWMIVLELLTFSISRSLSGIVAGSGNALWMISAGIRVSISGHRIPDSVLYLQPTSSALEENPSVEQF